MTLYDTSSLILATSGAAESLPDPAANGGLTHWLVNTALSSATWTTAGAGFVVDGANAASLTVAPGQSRAIQSNGTRWVAAPTSARRIFAGTAVTDGSGNATFTFTPPFAAAPIVAQAIETASTNAVEARVTTRSASSVTINARGTAVVVVLGINVLGAPTPLVGATVHLLAVDPGQGS